MILEHGLLEQVPALHDTLETLLGLALGGFVAKKVVLYWRFIGAPFLNALLRRDAFKQGEERRLTRADFERLLKESEERVLVKVREIFK